MKMYHKSLLLLGIFLTRATPAMDLSPLLSVGFDFGGEKMASFTYTDGKERSFRAASLATVTTGASLANPISDLDLSTRVSFGFKAVGLSASNASLDFFRWIFEVSEYFAFAEAPVQIGAGLSYHFSNKLNATGDAAALTSSVDPSLGVFVQGEYFLYQDKELFLGVKSASVGLRLIHQSYTTQINPSEKIGASGAGVHMNLFW